MKIEQSKVWGPELEPQVKQTALLASPIYTGQAQEKEKKHKKGSQNWADQLFSSLFWVGPLSCLEDVFSFAYQIKLNCNWAITLVHLSLQNLLWWDRTEEITNSPHTSMLFSIVAVSMYIPTNSARGFSFLHTLSSIYCLDNRFCDDSPSHRCEVISHCSFDLHFSNN